jgi:hypothetical protein
MREKEETKSNSLSTANGTNVEFVEGKVSGRWADTLQGERVNGRGGAGMHNPNDYTGGGKGTDSETDCGEVLSVGSVIATMVGASGNAPGAVLVGGVTLGAWGACKISNSLDSKEKKPATGTEGGNNKAKDPSPIDDPSTGSGVIVVGGGERVGTAIKRQTKSTGTAGGDGDGRGLNGEGGAGSTRYWRQAVGAHNGSNVGAPERDRDSGKVSLEAMLQQARFTNPGRA